MDERTVSVAGQRVRYRVTGAEDGRPAVLVHGLAGSTGWWAPILPAVRDRHRLYLVDLPGFGAMRRGGGFAYREAASWLLGWQESVGLTRVDLVGHSMGAAVCIRATAARPDLVRRLVLVAPAGLRTGRGLPGHVLPLLHSGLHVRPRFAAVLARDAVRAGPRTLLRAASHLLAEDVREDLARVVAPTLLVFGERDPLVPPTVGELFRTALPSADVVVIERSSHVPMFDRPAEMARILLRFLAPDEVPVTTGEPLTG